MFRTTVFLQTHVTLSSSLQILQSLELSMRRIQVALVCSTSLLTSVFVEMNDNTSSPQQLSEGKKEGYKKASRMSFTNKSKESTLHTSHTSLVFGETTAQPRVFVYVHTYME
jgi:hypothetical protein